MCMRQYVIDKQLTYVPAAHDASGHHTNGVESGDEIGSRWGEVEGQNNGQLEEHGIIDLRGAMK